MCDQRMCTRNIHIYQSDFTHESRILKETKSIVDSGLIDEIIIVAIWRCGLHEHEDLDQKRHIWRVPLKFRLLPANNFFKAFLILEWLLRVLWRYRNESIAVINCHSLLVLPLGILFKLFLKSKLVYDAHELETETHGSRGIRKLVAKMIERCCISFVDNLIVVSDSIADWYREKYFLKRIDVIKNVPYQRLDIKKHTKTVRKKFNIQADEIVFICQGTLDEGRGIEILLKVFSIVEKRKHIIFMGYGPLVGMVKEYEGRCSNIHFQPAVAPDEVILFTAGADVGISLIENTCLSYFYSLPNKVFEYIVSGLPTIVSDFPDMGKIVDKYRCGWKVKVDEKSVFAFIVNISERDILEKGRNSLKCRKHFGWDREEKKIVRLYKELGF